MEGPPVPLVEGPHVGAYAQGPHAMYEKNLVFKIIYSTYKIRKLVESLHKMDKSITFHLCKVICDVLRHTKLVHFLQRQHKLYLIFCVPIFLKCGQTCNFHWTPKSQKCFSFKGGFPDQGICPWMRPNPVTGASQLYLEGRLQLSGAAALKLGHVTCNLSAVLNVCLCRLENWGAPPPWLRHCYIYYARQINMRNPIYCSVPYA